MQSQGEGSRRERKRLAGRVPWLRTHFQMWGHSRRCAKSLIRNVIFVADDSGIIPLLGGVIRRSAGGETGHMILDLRI